MYEDLREINQGENKSKPPKKFILIKLFWYASLNEICGAHLGCTSEAVFACDCGNPVVFICRDCISAHLSEPSSHTIISLDQAREAIINSTFNENFSYNLVKYKKLKISIQNYIDKVKSFKQDLARAHNVILSLIEQEFQTKYAQIDSLQAEAQAQLDSVKARMKRFVTLEDEILHTFQTKGLKGLIRNYISSIEINIKNLSTSISSIFHISHEADEGRYLYIPKNNTNQLLKYNLKYNTFHSYDLPEVITPFDHTNSCILPDGNIILVGIERGYLGDTYRFDVRNNRCTQLSSLNTARSHLGLICYDNYLYAFGGYNGADMNTAEKMEWSGNGWSALPNMHSARGLPGVCEMSAKIFVIGGYRSTSIEYYDIATNTFSLVNDLKIPTGTYLAVTGNDKIYILSKGKVISIDTDFKIKEDIEVAPGAGYSFNNVVSRYKNIYSSNYGCIFIWDMESHSSSVYRYIT